MFTSLGNTSLNAGTNNTSSNVKPSINFLVEVDLLREDFIVAMCKDKVAIKYTKSFYSIDKCLRLYICFKKTLKKPILIVALFCLINEINAQESEIDLNPVTVTASIHPLNVSATGRNIFVLQSDYISKLPINSLDELLRYVPGIEIQARGPKGSQSDIVMRGGTFQQVLVIIDGLRLNDPNTGHFNGYIPIVPGEIDRIEILKGASSAVYGSDAVGGVINIITKTFKHQQKKNEVFGAISGGEFGWYNINSGFYYNNKKTAISGGILSNNAAGQQQRGTKGFFNNNTVSASIFQQINSNWSLNIASAFDNRKFAAQNFYTTFLSDTANENVASLWNRLRVDYKNKKNHFSLNAGYKIVKDEYQYNSVSIKNESTSKLLQLLALYEYEMNDKNNFVAGIQHQNRSIESNDRGVHSVQQFAGFFIWKNESIKNLHVSPALRLEWDANAGTELVPQVNISYALKHFHLRGSAGKTIRQADFTEQYNNYNKVLVTGGRIGNPNLAAENSFSYEIGADVFVIKNVKIATSIFRKEYSKLIDWVTTPYTLMPRRDNLSPTGNFALATNIARVNTNGFETDIQFSKTLKNKQSIYCTAGLLWLESLSSDSVPSLYVSAHANLLTNFSILYATKHFNFSVNGIYKSRAEQNATAIKTTLSKDYFVLNTKLDFIIKKQSSIFLQVDNVFNTSYSDLLGSSMPGRWFMGGIKIMFENKH
jgi:vitamin B12 transporter